MENKIIIVLLSLGIFAFSIDFANHKEWEYSDDGLYEYSLKDKHGSIEVTVKNDCEVPYKNPQIHFSSKQPVHKIDANSKASVTSDDQHFTVWSDSWNKEWKPNEQHTFIVTFNEDVDTSCLSNFVLLYNYDGRKENEYTHTKFAYYEQYDESKDNSRIPDLNIVIKSNQIKTDTDPMTTIEDSIDNKKGAIIYNLAYENEEGWEPEIWTKRVSDDRLEINGLTVGMKFSDISKYIHLDEHLVKKQYSYLDADGTTCFDEFNSDTPVDKDIINISYQIRYYFTDDQWIQSDLHPKDIQSDTYIDIDFSYDKDKNDNDNIITDISVIYINEPIPDED